MIFVRFKWCGLVLDQLLGQAQQFLVRLYIINIFEIALRFPDLVGITQRLQHHSVAAGLQTDDMFLSAYRKLAHPDFPGFPQSIA